MHSLISAAFKYNRTVMLLLIFLLIAGVRAYTTIPKEAEPDVAIPIIYVSMGHEGISPSDAERLLVRPMEKELQGITGVKEMRSTASEGHASVLLEFDAGFDSDTALADVRDKVDAAKSRLPEATDEPSVNEVNIALFPVLTISLSGPLPEPALLKIAKDLRDKLEGLPGVLEADIAGQREEVLEIIIDPIIMETYNVDFAAVYNLISLNNRLVAAGAIDTGAGRMVLKVPGVIEDLNDILTMPVKVEDDIVVTFGDVATIRRTYKDPVSFARLDGQPTLVLEISKRIGANIIDTIAAVREAVTEEQTLLPPNLKIGFHQDRSEQTRTMLGDLQNNVLTGIVLVMLVVTAALGLRSAALVGLAIPGSFLAGILVISSMGYTMNIIVLFSLILVVGMLVDGAIIVAELADRNIMSGMSRKEAFRASSTRMSWPIIASTATTLAVFFPLLFWPGLVGQFMRYLPITVIICLIAALFMALIFIPVLGSLIGRKPPAKPAEQYSADNPDIDNRKGVGGAYLSVLSLVLRYPLTTLLATIILTVATYMVYGAIGKGMEFFPDIEPEVMLVQVSARGDLSIFEKDTMVKEVEGRLLGSDGVESVYTRTFSYANAENMPEDVIGVIQMELEDWDQRRKARKIQQEMKLATADIPGIRLEFKNQENGPDGGKPINIQVSSLSADKRSLAADYLIGQMNEVGGFANIEDNRPLPGIEWVLDVDRERAARYGADIALLGNSIQLITSGFKVADYRPDDTTDEVDIRVRYPMDERNLSQLDDIRVPTRNGMVPITNFVEVKPAPKTGTIQRVDAGRVLTVQADMQEGFLADTQLKLLQQRLADGPVDPEVTISFKGEAEEMQETMIFLVTAFVSAIFLMVLILVTQFNSFYQAMLILSAVVFSTAGVLLGLIITAQPFGVVMCGMGIIALAGIVVNNNIVLIDTYNQFRSDGDPAYRAAMKTGAIRMRPVLLTAITTILGLMPMVLAMNINLIERDYAFGAPSTQWWTQLSSAIAGGLGFTTLLTLLLTPCLLVLGANVSDSMAARKERRQLRRMEQRAELIDQTGE